MSGLHIHVLLNTLNVLPPRNLTSSCRGKFLQAKQGTENARLFTEFEDKCYVFVQLLYTI